VEQLVVVDQSDAGSNERLVRDVIAAAPAWRPQLAYVWDPTIAGAAAARNEGFDRAATDLVVCMDDDMAPEPDVLERLIGHHQRATDFGAITPVIANYPPPALSDRTLTALFCRGPFHDDRQPVYWRWRRYGDDGLVPVRMLGAGMMTLRRAALDGVRFDRRYRGASVGEDLDLSWTLRARGWRLGIATGARVLHQRAPRPDARYEETLLMSWSFVFHKHQPPTLANRLAFAWFVVGVFVGSLCASLRSRSAAPLRSARAGLFGIRHDYANSTFLLPSAPATPEPVASGLLGETPREWGRSCNHGTTRTGSPT
jgi:GT2 family glycosyltransferase